MKNSPYWTPQEWEDGVNSHLQKANTVIAEIELERINEQ
jgi:hypothetical protein